MDLTFTNNDLLTTNQLIAKHELEVIRIFMRTLGPVYAHTVGCIMKIFKPCSCGLVHLHLPANARFQDSGDDLAGWYFECACKSTLFIPAEKRAA